MDLIKQERLKELLIKLKRVNQVYLKCNEEQQDRLMKASDGVLKELEGFGYDRCYLEGLLMGGGDFLTSLGKFEGMNTSGMAELIFK